jgi:hypothetical protein
MASQKTLIGRAVERATLGRLLNAVRGADSRVLVLRGEPGVGKTALLDDAIGSASDLRVLRAVGVESEMELAFAALHQLCAPVLDRLGRLPGPQQAALRVAFGLSGGEAPDRFLVGLAALSLLWRWPRSQRVRGAWGSQSTARVRRPAPANPAARLTAVIVLPTPLFWLAMARTIVTGSLPTDRAYRRSRPAGRGPGRAAGAGMLRGRVVPTLRGRQRASWLPGSPRVCLTAWFVGFRLLWWSLDQGVVSRLRALHSRRG